MVRTRSKKAVRAESRRCQSQCTKPRCMMELMGTEPDSVLTGKGERCAFDAHRFIRTLDQKTNHVGSLSPAIVPNHPTSWPQHSPSFGRIVPYVLKRMSPIDENEIH